jgi:hypothetical protein
MQRLMIGFAIVLLGVSAALAQAPAPVVTINLGARQAKVAPVRQGFTHTGGGNIDVAQPAPDTVIITMTGVAVAGAHPTKASSATLQFDLEQAFEVTFEKPEVKKARLTLEGRVIGLLRSHKGGGTAEVSTPGSAVVLAGPVEVLGLHLPATAVSCGENLSINNRHGPEGVTVKAGAFTLHQVFGLTAAHPRSLKFCKAASAEFAPDPALDPLWISYWEPFHGAAKKDFGFQIILRVAPENGAAIEKKAP